VLAGVLFRTSLGDHFRESTFSEQVLGAFGWYADWELRPSPSTVLNCPAGRLWARSGTLSCCFASIRFSPDFNFPAASDNLRAQGGLPWHSL
jgi:hypothetical protein